MNKKKIILFAVCLALLLALQIKFLLPVMYDIAASDLFLVESKDNASSMPISNDMTAIAFSQCNNYISTKIDSDSTASLPTSLLMPGALAITNTSLMRKLM
jgi:hypothetical protein